MIIFDAGVVIAEIWVLNYNISETMLNAQDRNKVAVSRSSF